MGAIKPNVTAAGDVRTGLVKVKIDGVIYRVKGAVDYDLGNPLREEIIGQDGVHGFKETPKAAYLECAVTDGKSYDIQQILDAEDVTATLELNNGKVITFSNCFQASDGKINTEESEITLKWVSMNRAIEV